MRPLAIGLALAAAAATAHAGIDLTLLPGIATSASACYLGCGNANHDHANIIDNDRLTQAPGSWNSGGYHGWVQVDFGQAYALERIELYAIIPYTNAFALSVSVDGASFTPIATGAYHNEPGLSLGPDGNYAGQKWGAYFTFAPGSEPLARYLRYTRTDGRDWGYLTELEVTGHLNAPPVPEPGTWAMLLAGLAGVGQVVRRRRR